MTRNQFDALAYIKNYISARGYAPSYDEIRVALGVKSKSHVSRVVKGLEALGQIRRMPYRARALEIVADPVMPTLSGFSLNDLAHEAKRRGLVLGHIHGHVQHLSDGQTEYRREFQQIIPV